MHYVGDSAARLFPADCSATRQVSRWRRTGTGALARPTSESSSRRSRTLGGRSRGSLSSRWDPATSAPNVPEHVRISGNVISYEDVRDLVSEIKGVEKGEIRNEDLEEHTSKLYRENGRSQGAFCTTSGATWRWRFEWPLCAGQNLIGRCLPLLWQRML